jgi:hypothetical protein
MNKAQAKFEMQIRIQYRYGTMPVSETAKIPDIF